GRAAASELPRGHDPEAGDEAGRGAVPLAAERPSGDVHRPHLRTEPIPAPPAPARRGRWKLVAAAAVTLALGVTVAGLLAFGREAPRESEHGSTPTLVIPPVIQTPYAPPAPPN